MGYDFMLTSLLSSNKDHLCHHSITVADTALALGCTCSVAVMVMSLLEGLLATVEQTVGHAN